MTVIIPTTPNRGGIAGMTTPNRGINGDHHRDVEEGHRAMIGRDNRDVLNQMNGNGTSPWKETDGECDGEMYETIPLLTGVSPAHTLPLSPNGTGDSLPGSCLAQGTTNNDGDQNISFREILPRDRRRIQELFEEWFPVDYKTDFYDNLCNHRTMADQKLYTLVATTPGRTAPGTPSGGADASDGETIIACLLGCKLNILKLNKSSRTLLIPGYKPKSGSGDKNGISDADLDQTVDELCKETDAGKDGPRSGDDEDDVDEILLRTDVFYIMTLGVIEEYRKRGLASFLLETALEDQIVVAREDDDNNNGGDRDGADADGDDPAAAEVCPLVTAAEKASPLAGSHPRPSDNNNKDNRRCETAYLHVIIQNKAAIRFYEKLGFVRLREIVDYYTINDQKHNCYLYAKFFDKASTERRNRGGYFCYDYYPIRVLLGGMEAPSYLADLVHRTVHRLIASVWSSISCYWVFDGGEGGRDSAIAAVAKNK